ncbi:CBS domain-containing protein [Nonomuraea sediminis]|uniref:CBS domain-containing protein n=1 Tax=Nonomuraea sediminis TaxID=2835864 RepID=UPI001BDCD1FD|nr:CBS domain-containing protein [Nonomuraea sediminis]
MRVEDLTAGQVMSRVLVVVEPEESVLMAWELMRRACVHHLPVSRRGRLLGVLTREDVAAAWQGGPDAQSRYQVKSLVAGRRTPHVQPSDPMSKVAAAMLDAQADAVPVMADSRIVGLITTTDLLEAIAGRTSPREEHGEIVTGMFRIEPVIPSMVTGT